MKSPLTEIPGVGTRIAAVMEALGLREVSDLRGRDPEELYLRDCARFPGQTLDRCCLYVYRLAVAYAEGRADAPEKRKWWYWKDKPYPEEEDL